MGTALLLQTEALNPPGLVAAVPTNAKIIKPINKKVNLDIKIKIKGHHRYFRKACIIYDAISRLNETEGSLRKRLEF